ncbi:MULTISPECIES: DUF4142 domain-containing protein [Burkholderiaceae]|nr:MULTISPECIES: DUF4142 domain-containing protein [Burkholderiaceae]MCG1018361.1 DUF4142 domain-containing protein [Mycetohabitans sp. B4]MCG1039238.1 DUF4142 domain-containing protein [Mycetohabitans sp. B7]SIT66439.1 Predicted outer membrane protein [Burkholderia sp. b13]SIT67995.1 Predicted outer membrane protein [Burkholderia sp. b14]
MKLTTLACIGALVLTPVVHAQTQAASTTAANPLSSADRDFIQAATMSSSTEIDAGKMAHKNTSNPDVRSFARHMIADHMRLTVQLKAVAPHGVEVPKDNSDIALLESLKPLTGSDFDHAYVRKVGLEAHRQAIAAFEKEAKEGENPSLKEAALKALPTLREHYLMSQKLAQKLGVAE